MSEILWCADNGDGTYRNPVLYCDYSDPDAICVNGTYYLTASTFNYVPGLPILTSRDLVNWKLRNYAVKNIPEARYAAPQHAQGIWAPAIRFQNGRFYIYYGMPDEGIYMVSTENPLGDWDSPVLVKPGKGLIDPCPFWDDDGCAYIIHGYAKSRIGFKSWLGIFPLSPDGRTALGDDHLLYDGTKKHPTIEGPKVHKRGGWYYIFAPAGGVATGWQVCLRSRSISGPYETQVVLKQGSSETNGPHQGAWVETPEGEHWFLHFQSRGLYGRVTHLQPMMWQADGWPIIGEPVPGETYGTPVERWRKPTETHQPPLSLQCSDDFADSLGLQWQFMGNWRADFYAVDGGLTLAALPAPNGILWNCPHVLTQKIAAPAFTAEVTLDARALQIGEQAGFGLIGGQYAYIALRRTAAGMRLVFVQSDGEAHQERVCEEIDAPAEQLALRMVLQPTGDDTARAAFAYQHQGDWRRFGEPFSPARHTWVGARMALFAMSLDGENHGGAGKFGPFRVTKA